MTPVLALWPEKGLDGLRIEVDCRMAADSFGPQLYSSETWTGDKTVLARAFDGLIRLDAPDTTLHVAVMLPLWEPDICAMAQSIVSAAAACGHSYSFDFICLQSALHPDTDAEAEPHRREAERKAIAAVTELCSKAVMPCRLNLADNYSSTGAPAGLNQMLLAKFLCALLRVMIENFADTFGRNQPSAAGEPAVVAPGLSVLEFHRDLSARHLLCRAFVAALDRCGVMQDSVDAQGASERARVCLHEIDRFYNKFYEKHVEPLVSARMPEGEIAAKIRKPLDEEIKALRQQLTGFMADDSLSLPEKEATWAVILGRDNPLLDGTLYKQQRLSIDDGLTEPASLFIEAYNLYAGGDDTLPVPSRYPALARPDRDNAKAFNPLPQIKTLKSELLDITAYMRAKEKELEDLRRNADSRTIAEGHLSAEGFVFKGVARPLENNIVEQPLQEEYTPAPGLKPQPSVDLREYFSPARDQGPVGSCTAFAVISIYEAIANRARNGIGGNADLSERFIFYHTNGHDGRLDEGSSYSDQLGVLGRYGTCAEALCPYSADKITEAPTAEATADALNHRVLSARQVPLRTDGDQYECVSANHTMLTSALSEGYPVGISLRMFNGFGSEPGGHVPRPTDEQIATEPESWHAMVLVGYSERDRCYIVRNSWGEDFGDRGYAYISAGYIDDASLCRFACIISETTDGTPVGTIATPALVAPFAGTETDIRIASISNALDDARLRYKSLAATYEELYRYYADLMQKLSQPFVRNHLRSLAEQAAAERTVFLKEKRDTLVAEMPGKLRRFCRDYIKGALHITAIAVACTAIYLMFRYFHLMQSVWWAMLPAVPITVCIGVWLHYKWARKRKRRELKEECEDAAQQHRRSEEDYLTKQMRFHVAGMVIDSLWSLTRSLETDYQRLLSFDNNLRCWHAEDSERVADLDTENAAMFINLTDADLLAQFFEKHRDGISGNISLTKALDSYTEVSPEAMQRVRDELENNTLQAIESLFADFSMASYLMGVRNYSYLPAPQLDVLLKRLNRMSTALTRHRSADNAFETRHLIVAIDHASRQKWNSMCAPHFAFMPQTLDSDNPDSLTLLTFNLIRLTDLI